MYSKGKSSGKDYKNKSKMNKKVHSTSKGGKGYSASKC